MIPRRAGRARPPAVVLAWAGVLIATVGIGLAGQTSPAPHPEPPDDPPARLIAPPEATVAALEPSWTRGPARPTRTRPPIGEDGVMGGLVFGTAWGWLEPRAPDQYPRWRP